MPPGGWQPMKSLCSKFSKGEISKKILGDLLPHLQTDNGNTTWCIPAGSAITFSHPALPLRAVCLFLQSQRKALTLPKGGSGVLVSQPFITDLLFQLLSASFIPLEVLSQLATESQPTSWRSVWWVANWQKTGSRVAARDTEYVQGHYCDSVPLGLQKKATRTCSSSVPLQTGMLFQPSLSSLSHSHWFLPRLSVCSAAHGIGLNIF